MERLLVRRSHSLHVVDGADDEERLLLRRGPLGFPGRDDKEEIAEKLHPIVRAPTGGQQSMQGRHIVILEVKKPGQGRTRGRSELPREGSHPPKHTGTSTRRSSDLAQDGDVIQRSILVPRHSCVLANIGNHWLPF